MFISTSLNKLYFLFSSFVSTLSVLSGAATATAAAAAAAADEDDDDDDDEEDDGTREEYKIGDVGTVVRQYTGLYGIFDGEVFADRGDFFDSR